MSFIAVLDANVLWPAALRCTLVRAALLGLYRPAWTEQILEEMANALTREGRVREARIRRTVELMQANLPFALVTGYESLIPAMTNHLKDRHVLAAAVRAGAGTIVTSNLRDFPEQSRKPFGITLHTPDEFLLDLWNLNAPVIALVLREQAAVLRAPTMSPKEILAGMQPLAPRFAEKVLGSDLLGDGETIGAGALHEARVPYE